MPSQLVFKEKPITDKILTIKRREGKKVSLAIRRTLDGNLLIQDHHSMNIVIIPEKGKIISFPKEEYTQDCYADQDDLFKFLTLSGVITPETINGGTIFGSLEANFPVEKKGEEEPFEVVILNVSNFLNKAKSRHKIHKKFIDDLEKQLLEPDEEESTELGEIPQDKFKGSIPKWGFPTKGVYRYNY